MVMDPADYPDSPTPHTLGIGELPAGASVALGALAVRLREGMAELSGRHAGGRDPFETASALAGLAQAITTEVHALTHARFVRMQGRAVTAERRPCRHAVLAVGAAGRGALDFGLRLSLVYVYETDEGASEGAHGLTPRLDLHAYHVRFFGELTRALTEVGLEVDLDRRPEGPGGPICNSVEALERYYESFGRSSDRKVLVSARPFAGDTALGAEVLASLAPFVFRRTLDQALTADLQLPGPEQRWATRTVAALVDELVDSFCLGLGGRFPALRAGTSPQRIAALARHRLLGESEAADLVELQRTLWGLVIDESVSARQALGARTADAPEPTTFTGDLSKIRELVTSLTSAARSVMNGLIAPEALAVLPHTTREARGAALAELGFARPPLAAERIDQLARHPESPFHPENLGDRLAERLIAAASSSPDPDAGLSGIGSLVLQLRHKRAVKERLARDPNRLERLVRLFASHRAASRHLLASPPLLSRLLLEEDEPGLAEPATLLASLRAEVSACDDDPSQVLTRLRRFRADELTRLAWHAPPPAEAARARALVAETVLVALALALSGAHSADALPLLLIARGGLASGQLEEDAPLELELMAPPELAASAARFGRTFFGALATPSPEGLLYALAPSSSRLRVAPITPASSDSLTAPASRVLAGRGDLRALLEVGAPTPDATVGSAP